MIKGLNKLIAAGILTTSAVTATVAPATKVNAETIVSVGKNKKVDIEKYKVLPIDYAIAWAYQTYGECHVVTKELPKGSGRFVYAIYNGSVPNEWSPVPDKNIYSFGYLDRTTGGYALCTDYYDYPLSQNEIDELLKEKEEEIKEEEKDSFYDDSSYSSAWVNRYKKKAKAYKYAYKKYKKGFAAIMREVENPYDPGNRAVVYAFTTSFEEVNNGWSYVADEDIPEDAYIFYTQTGSEDAKNYYYAIVNDMTYKKLLK